jgi:hypothetical protein
VDDWYARDRLFREIVVFANAQGGTLILGIEETEDNPPRAADIRPVPRVHDLAMRLDEAAHACIEPRLPALQAVGVVTHGSDAGVVIFRVTPSPVAPHRVASDGHAYIRRNARSVKMTMREIQDLTLDLARGAERLDALFADRAAAFHNGCSARPRESEPATASLPCQLQVCQRSKEVRLEPNRRPRRTS